MEAGRFVAPVPPGMRWSLIDLSMWSHLAQKDGAPTCSSTRGGGGGGRKVDYTHATWDFFTHALTFVEDTSSSFTLIQPTVTPLHPLSSAHRVDDDGDRRHDRTCREDPPPAKKGNTHVP